MTAIPDQPGGASLRGDANASTDDIAEIREHLAKLQDRLDTEGLGWEGEYRQELLREVKQRIELRDRAIIIAGVVMAAMAAFAWCAISYLTADREDGAVVAASHVGLFIAPIVSLTAITIMVVVGPFKRAKDEDKDHVQTPNIIVEGTKIVADRLSGP